MKSHFILFFCLFLVLNTHSQTPEKRLRIFLEPEINYSFIENKRIKTSTFSSNLSLGFGFSGIVDLKLNSKFNLLSGIRLTSTNYNYSYDYLQYRTNYIGFSIPFYLEYNIKNIHKICLGSDFSFRSKFYTEHMILDKFNTISSVISTTGYSTITTPLIIGYSHYFKTKKERNLAVSLYLKKGLQTQENIVLKKYENSSLLNTSSFSYKGTRITISIRYYLKKAHNKT